MKTKLTALFYICLCAVNISAQTYRFDLVDDKQDNYVAEINMLAKTVSLSKNGNALFSSTFYSTKKDWNSMVAFSFKQDQEPPMDLVSKQQYFIVLESSIQCNDPSQKNLYSLNAKSPSAYTAVYKELNEFLLGKYLYLDDLDDVSFYLEEAQKGDAFAQYKLGTCYHNGVGVEKNLPKAIEWYKKSAEQGNVYAQYVLGLSIVNYNLNENKEEGLKWLKKAEKQGFAWAQFMIGNLYEFGRGGCEIDFHKALSWYEKASEQGLLTAVVQIADMYRSGNGVNKDATKAAEWYARAAKEGDRSAQSKYAQCLWFGEGVKQDVTEAMKWYKKVIDGNETDVWAKHAMYDLGGIYYLNKSYTDAINWFRKSADLGDGAAQYMLGVCYYYGKGVPMNRKEAKRWITKAAEQGNNSAIKALNEGKW